MTRTAGSRAAARLDDGLRELAAGRWMAARAAFEAALELGQTPDALEGLSWAAWWLDDAEAVFAARERAYGLYKKRGDAADAARVATWLASDHLDFRGSAAVAAGWLRRASRLLDRLETGPEHGWLAFHKGYLAHLTGDTEAALEAADRAADIGRRFDVPDLEMLGLALEGGVLVACARVSEGMGRLDEATATALEGEATIPISAAWAFCFLVSACVDVRDYRRAFDWSDRIAEFAKRYDSRYMLGYCRAQYGAVDLSRGRWADAETGLQSAVEDFARSRPAFVADALVWLAELRRRQGRPDESVRLLDHAGDGPGSRICRARLALDAGDALRAAELAERCLRQLAAERKLDRVAALETLLRARILRGELAQAGSVVDALRETARAVGTALLRASAGLAEGMLAAASGDHQRARALLEDATDVFERNAAPFEAHEARVELATSLLGLGRHEVAGLEATRAQDGLRRLGATTAADRAGRILAACRFDVGGRRRVDEISAREREVLALLAEGLTNRQIAERLVVSEHTVHRHVTNILRKLDLPSRTAAAARAIRAGLVERSET